MNHLADALLAASRQRPAQTFALETDGRVTTNADLLTLSGRYANLLRELGVTAGDRIAVQVEKSLGAVALYIAALRCGAIFLPLNTAYTPAEIEYFLGDAKPALFICDDGKRAALEPIAKASGAAVETLDDSGRGGSLNSKAVTHSSDHEDAARGADDLAVILYTSGTTGRSKGAMITADNLLSNARTLISSWRITDKDVLLHALPIFHAHGLFVGLHTILLAGASLVFLPKFDGNQVVDFLPSATMFMGVPTFFTRLIEHPDLARAATRIRLFVSGSAPLLAETHKQFSAITGQAILERYGMTETGMNTSNPFDGERRAGTVGFPLPGIEIRVADGDGKQVAKGDVGVIEIRGPNVFVGYWGMPQKTAAEFRADRYFISGDLGKIDEDGYIHIVGREKDLIISGGYNVYPKEVESEIDAIEGVDESAVIGLPHKDFGEAVTAVLVARKNATVCAETVKARLKDRLANYKQPKQVIIVSELPRNAMGKVQKAALREQYRNLYER
ncbi:malonyl-CoA synthase [Corticibacterium sp. UT-5YL-CI-8]|nr:malonyl-CoA synthase [Tianweitania sp. UT-5YL-CI-8]